MRGFLGARTRRASASASALVTDLTDCGRSLFRLVHTPDICHFFNTGRMFGSQILHPKMTKTPKNSFKNTRIASALVTDLTDYGRSLFCPPSPIAIVADCDEGEDTV